VLFALAVGELQRWVVQGFLSARVLDDAIGVYAAVEVPVERPLGVERHVRTVVALAEAGIPEQVYRRILLQEIEQPLSKRERAARAAVRPAAHDDVHIR
jgi:hypothetical protein